jgi:predicted nucleic acid-binding protein
VQGARDKDDLRIIKRFLAELGFTVLPLTENIGHRSLVYVEEYGLSAGLRAGDAIIAASAVENALPLMSANSKHFRPIKELELVIFRP